MGHSKTFALFAAMGLAAVAQAQSTQDESRAYAAEMLADASGRTSTLAQPAAPLVQLGGQIQFRYYFSSRDNVVDDPLTPEAEDDLSLGFQTRRTKLEAKGEVADGWTYFVQINADFADGTVGLQEAWVKYQINENSNLQWGQIKLPLLREELVSSKRQLAVERSLVNELFTQDRSQGIQYGWDSDNIRARGAFSDGLDTENSDFNANTEADFALTGRFEYKGAGDWKQFDQFTSWQGSAFGWMIGAAAHYQDGGSTDNTFDLSALEFTIDGSLVGSGWNAFGAFVYRSVDPAAAASTDDFGFVIQGGVFFSPQWEVFGRWDGIFPDDSIAGSTEDFWAFTVGVNYYVIPESHALKFSGDFSYFDGAPGLSIAPTGTGTGLLPSLEDSQFLVRLQFQLLF